MEIDSPALALAGDEAIGEGPASVVAGLANAVWTAVSGIDVPSGPAPSVVTLSW